MLLILLCAFLVLWRPLTFAAEAATTIPSLHLRGPVAAFELIAHGAAAALAAAAGLALWRRAPAAVPLARAALVTAAAVSVQSLYWSALPSQTRPGEHLPLAILAVVHAAAWLFYLQKYTTVTGDAGERATRASQ